MSRDVHVRFCEQLGGEFPGLTRLIIGFSDKSDAERVMKVLPKRFAKYNLTLHPDKTRMVDLNSQRGISGRSFDFLGFTHYLGKSRKGNQGSKT